MHWSWERELFLESEGTPVLPVLLGATNLSWIEKYALRSFPWSQARWRARLRRNISEALGPSAILGHWSSPGLSAPGSGIYLAGEPGVPDQQMSAWASTWDLDFVHAETARLLSEYGDALVCWLLNEPAWNMLAGAGEPGRTLRSVDECIVEILTWIGVIRALDTSRPIVWSEACVEPRQEGNWTRSNVLRVFEGVGDAVQIHGANWYTQTPRMGTRPWWWQEVPGAKGLTEIAWLPYDWEEQYVDERRLTKNNERLPRKGERSYPECQNQSDRLYYWTGMGQNVLIDPDCKLFAYYGGIGHDGGGIYRPWGLIFDPASWTWFPTGAIRETIDGLRRTWADARTNEDS